MGLYKRGATFWARWTQDGVKHRRSLGTTDPAEAERLFAKLTGEDARTRADGALTVAEVLRAWYRFQSTRRRSGTLLAYRVVIRRFALMWGKKAPAEITRRVIEDAQDAMLAAKLAPRTINTQLGFALTALRWAHEREMPGCPEPPKFRQVPLKSRSPQKYLTAAEMEKLFEAVKAPRFMRLRPVVMLAAYAGLRMGEIIALRWEDVDLDSGWIHIRPRKDWAPKTATSARSIPITGELAQCLSRLTPEGRWVAPRVPGQQWTRSTLNRSVLQLFEAAGVRGDGFHTTHRLRGTFATEVLKASGDLRSLQAMLGHANLSVTSMYLSEVDEHKRSAVRGLRFGV
jgi:integrase